MASTKSCGSTARSRSTRSSMSGWAAVAGALCAHGHRSRGDHPSDARHARHRLDDVHARIGRQLSNRVKAAMSGAGLTREPAELILRVDAVQHCAVDVVSLELADPFDRPLPSWEPGAHVDVTVAGGLVRQYSLCGDPRQSNRWRIAVRREPGGRGPPGSSTTESVPAMNCRSADRATTSTSFGPGVTCSSRAESASPRYCRWLVRLRARACRGPCCTAVVPGSRWHSSASSAQCLMARST